MTQTSRKLTGTRPENQEAVSFRLPTILLERLDETVQAEGSSRTAVIRSALAVYHRLAKGGTLLVPVTVKTQEQLKMLGELKQCPEETLAGELLKNTVEQCIAKEQKGWNASLTFSVVRTSPKPQRTQTIVIKSLVTQ
ncbi:ribbon-helix-helix domain-containing protein [Deinococcus frigens]|uniref:ribbon-helix-helix domain-containing protein n=1 Tax=Deinococcus frigens TaxID=249403 RepID=UPI000A0164B3|nr:ribbon-helix-helix domain-containing protein [Deinococcus frigens]